jgi:hypothetical protein
MGRKRARCFGAGYQIWSGYVTEFSDTWIRIKTNTVAVGRPQGRVMRLLRRTSPTTRRRDVRGPDQEVRS